MNLIVAADQNWAIGRGGDQLVYLPADLRRFKSLTMGHPVILGRKTLATFPGGQPLKGRRNLILSRDRSFAPEGAEVYRDLHSLLTSAPEDSFVVGGASVYKALLPYCSIAYVTKLLTTFPADCYFPNLDTEPDWILTEMGEDQQEHGIHFQYRTYTRI